MSKRLFKGKDIIGNWYSGNMSVLEKDLNMGAGIIRAGSYISNSCGSPFAYQIRPETVGQFTGLYAGVFNSLCGDKEYDEIYEGDKISVTYATQGMSNSHEHTITGVVKFKNGSFVVEWDFPNKGKYRDQKGKYRYQTLNSVKRLGDCEVVIKIIGNIHDNTELVEVTE